MAFPKVGLIMIPLSLPFIYYVLQSKGMIGDVIVTNNGGGSVIGSSSSSVKDAIENNNNYWSLKTTPKLQKQIPCGLLMAPRSENVHPLSTVLVDSTSKISTITRSTLEEHRLTAMIESGNWIPAGSLWLRIDEATVPAPALQVVNPEKDQAGIPYDYNLKLGKDFLTQNGAMMKIEDDDEEAELFLRVNDKEVLIPFILPRLPFDAGSNVQAASSDNGGGGGAKSGGSQLILREQVPCGVILASQSGGVEVHPLSTIIDTTIASSTISAKAVKSIPGLAELVASEDSEHRGMIPPGSFSLRMDEATVPSPLLRVLEDDINHEPDHNLVLGMFFLKEHGGQMIDGELYIEANEGEAKVLIPFIKPRSSLSFDEAKEEL